MVGSSSCQARATVVNAFEKKLYSKDDDIIKQVRATPSRPLALPLAPTFRVSVADQFGTLEGVPPQTAHLWTTLSSVCQPLVSESGRQLPVRHLEQHDWIKPVILSFAHLTCLTPSNLGKTGLASSVAVSHLTFVVFSGHQPGAILWKQASSESVARRNAWPASVQQ